MEITSNRDEIIFRNDYNGKPIYSIGLSKKKKDGNYENGYMTVNFKEGTDIQNKSKIKIKNAWLSFYKKEDKTIPTIFINEYELVGEPKPKETELSVKTETQSQFEITDDDLPF